MNAKQQYRAIMKRVKVILDQASTTRKPGWYIESDWDAVCVRIIKDLKAKLDAYGDEAFPLSEKQMTAVQEYVWRWEAALEVMAVEEAAETSDAEASSNGDGTHTVTVNGTNVTATVDGTSITATHADGSSRTFRRGSLAASMTTLVQTMRERIMLQAWLDEAHDDGDDGLDELSFDDLYALAN